MNNREKKRSEINSSFDEIIKMGVQMELEKEDNTPILTDSEMEMQGYSLPPDDMYKRITDACSKNNKYETRHRKIKWKRVIAIAAAIAVLMCGMMSVNAVRVYIFKLIHQITNNSIQFSCVNETEKQFDVDESEAYSNAEDSLGVSILIPTYLPDGFEFEQVKIYPSDHIVLIYENGDKSIKITQSLIKDYIDWGEMIDTKTGKVDTINISGTDIMISQYNQENTEEVWLAAVWNDEYLLYKIDTNIEERTLKKIISAME